MQTNRPWQFHWGTVASLRTMQLGRKKTLTNPYKKCGGTGQMEPSEKVREIFGDHKFVCDRCGGTKTERAPR